MGRRCNFRMLNHRYVRCHRPPWHTCWFGRCRQCRSGLWHIVYRHMDLSHKPLCCRSHQTGSLRLHRSLCIVHLNRIHRHYIVYLCRGLLCMSCSSRSDLRGNRRYSSCLHGSSFYSRQILWDMLRHKSRRSMYHFGSIVRGLGMSHCNKSRRHRFLWQCHRHDPWDMSFQYMGW